MKQSFSVELNYEQALSLLEWARSDEDSALMKWTDSNGTPHSLALWPTAKSNVREILGQVCLHYFSHKITLTWDAEMVEEGSDALFTQ